MDKDKHLINALLSKSNLPVAHSVRHLGAGELNNSYLAITVDGQHYCIRIAKYAGKSGLLREADALSRLPEGIGPRLIHCPDDTLPLETHWLIESFIDGQNPERLNTAQFHNLGSKLALVHAIDAPAGDVINQGEVTGTKNDLWPYLVWCCRSFYTEYQLLHDLPDKRLLALCRKSRQWFEVRKDLALRQQSKQLLHKDMTPSNLLVRGGEVFLIDWELRDFGDPMTDFATGFWDDVEYNRGKWRIILLPEERTALYRGYTEAGGIIDEERIRLWVIWDKLGSAVFLCHRVHRPPPGQSTAQTEVYKEDLENIIGSLQRTFT